MNKFAYGLAAVVALAGFGIASQAMAADAFDIADGNGDHFVSYAEAAGFYPTLPREIFNMADDNKDGKLDQGEFTELSGLTAGFPSAQLSPR